VTAVLRDEIKLGAGFDLAITRVIGGWQAVVTERINVAGPGVYRTEVISARPPHANLDFVIADAHGDIVRNLQSAPR
jgi:hypothetical protein